MEMIARQRVFLISDYMKSSENEPLRTVVAENSDCVIVAWHLDPGQKIPLHIHPNGQDSWTVLKGEGRYFLDSTGSSQKIKAGDVVIAAKGDPHGVLNLGPSVLEFISVVSPGDAGYQLLDS